MAYSSALFSDTTLGPVCVPTCSLTGARRFSQYSGPAQQSPQPWSGSISPTACVTLRWSTAILQDYILSRASNLLWLAWPNFGSKGTFFPLWVLLTTHWRKKKMFLKGFLLFLFLRKFREFNNCRPLANT